MLNYCKITIFSFIKIFYRYLVILLFIRLLLYNKRMSSNLDSRNKIKLKKSLQLVDDLTFEFVNEFIFESIIDCFRINYGFPCATLLSDLILDNSVLPKTPEDLSKIFFDSASPEFMTKCPFCNQNINDGNFTDHWKNNCIWFQQNDFSALESHVFHYFD